MITQPHENEIQQKAQAASPAKLHRWVVVLLSILGVALPMVGGWWVEWPLVDIFPSDNPYMGIFVGGVVFVVVPVTIGAFLLCFAFRKWWVAVFAGVAWYVSNILITAVHQIVLSGHTELAGVDTIIGITLIPILFSMILGAACAHQFVKWRASRQAAILS